MHVLGLDINFQHGASKTNNCLDTRVKGKLERVALYLSSKLLVKNCAIRTKYKNNPVFTYDLVEMVTNSLCGRNYHSSV
jgi:hypothetical protein